MVPLAIVVYLAIGVGVIYKIETKPAYRKHTAITGNGLPTAVVAVVGWALSIVFWPLVAANEAIN